MNHQLILFLMMGLFICTKSEGIRCITCINARSNEECNEIGKIEQCEPNKQSCQNEVRLNSPNGFGYLITKRCKQPKACKNNQDQNHKPAWDATQCNVMFNKNSVCRCCCEGDLCNKKELPCSDIQRCPARDEISNGIVTCTNNNFQGSLCSYKCNQGFELKGTSVIRCENRGLNVVWSDVEPICIPGSCKAPMSAPVNGRIQCSDGIKVGSSCQFTCSLGYRLIGKSNTQCSKNGKWTNSAPTCERITCPGQQIAPSNGNVVCSGQNYYESVCQFACSPGYYLDGFATTSCQIDGKWSSSSPSCKRVFCDVRDNKFPNGKSSCSDRNFYNSECTYSCNEGFYMVGSPVSKCLADFKWSTDEPRCEQITCSGKPRSPQHGSVICSDGDLYASVCMFSCGEGYFLEGSSTSTCESDFRWSAAAPVCKRITCSIRHEDLENGKVKCTKGNDYQSICKFSCNDGFFLSGSEILTCEENFEWSLETPVCKAYECGPQPAAPINGKVKCSNGNRSFSKCEFVCGDGGIDWESKGETTSTCKRDPIYGVFTWDNEPPCCAKRCPPFAQVDLFVVLDSSSSVGLDNWNKTLYFVNGVINDFEISTNDMLVAAVRYNAVIDTTSEIKIGTYTDKKSTQNAIINLPYDGQGTNTGNALQYVLDSMLSHPGNRPNVQDMVLLVTDGISRDDVKVPARKLRRTGTNVVVLGISNKKGSLKQEDILDISGDPEKTVVSTTGFDGLTPDLVNIITKQVCTNPCDRQNQYGDFGANFGLQ